MHQLFRHILRLARFGTDLRAGTLAVLCVLAANSRKSFNLQPGWSTGRVCDRPIRRPEVTALRRDFGRALWFSLATLCLMVGMAPSASAATLPGTQITNQATVNFAIGGVTQLPEASNQVVFNIRSKATLEFLTYAPTRSDAELVAVPGTAYQNGGGFNPIPAPPEIATQPVPLVAAEIYHAGTPFYLRLTDLDQNSDPATVQTVLITVTVAENSDTEVLRLTETGFNTGVFVGYLPSFGSGSAARDGILLVTPDCHVSASYSDAFDGSDSTADAALVDPYGYVFDSATGIPLDGAIVTLIDLATGLPATTIVGDNGATGFPASIVTGSVFDFGGITYSNPAGGFRFPFVPPGNYKLVVISPDGYVLPSSVSDAELQSRSWWDTAGYVIADGSRGGSFSINPGPAIRIDIPADPLQSYLWLQKDVSRDIASTGDFLQYTLTLENGNLQAAATGLTVTDHLPLGFRYQKGSSRIAGRKVADPAISADGRTLNYALGILPAGNSVTINYVVEIAAGAKAGKAVNSARATDANGISSNTARAAVTVREEFFRNVTFLVGRILEGACSDDDTVMKGIPGVRVYLEDGTYVVTDQDGRYHFEGVEVGVHVVQVDLSTLPADYEMLPCEQTSQFAGRTFSQFVDLRGGTLWRVNFYAAPKPPPTGMAGLSLETKLNGRQATFSIGLSASTVPLDNLRLTVMLPAGARFITGTASRDGQSLADPQAFDEAVTFRFPSLGADQHSTIVFQADLSGTKTAGELPAKALLTFDTPAVKNQRTPFAEVRFHGTADELTTSEEIRLFPRFPSFIAELQETDRAMLEQLAAQLQAKRLVSINLAGHADSQEISPRSQHIFRDNQALSVARAQSVADFLMTRLAIPAEAISVQGMGDTMPLADNLSEAGRAQNRRVELFVVGETVNRTEKLELAQPSSLEQTVATAGIRQAVDTTTTQPLALPPIIEAPQIDQTWLATAQPATVLVWPPAGYVPQTPSTTINVQHQRGQQVNVTLNGQSVPALNFDGQYARQDGQVVVSSWKGVDLVSGRNTIEAIVTTGDGQVVGRDFREIWFTDTPVYAELLTDHSRLVADGISPPGLAVRLTDSEGHPIRPGMYIDVSIAPPFRGLLDNFERENQTLALATGKSRFKTGADGIVIINLEPTTQTGEVSLSIPLKEQTVNLSAWLNPAPRDWILVGFAEGTVGYNTISDNLVSAEEAGIDEHGYTDGRVKFFAKGAIKGEWLLTMAYDSDKPDLDGDSLQQMIDPDTYYPLYGDETQQGYEAASARDIYVKLERDQFYALFGDMETGLTQTVLSQYSRSMNGFKSEMQSERFAYTVFAADTRQAFVKDELRGDGTSGRYPLSQKDLVINSEEVVIETRDRFHNERIVREERLSRHVDYDIDFEAGTLWFKRPVPSKDQDFNPVFIVVRYETEGSAETNLNYGGRAAVRVLDQQVEVGASLIHEENGAAEGDLYGADVTANLTPQTTLRAEVATTDVEEIDDRRKGDAYLAEIEHLGEQFDGRAWFRQQDPGFGLGQQNGGTEGLRTYGAEGAYRLSPSWSLAGELWHEDNLDSDAKRDVGSVQALYRAERYGLSAGVREARDRFEDGEQQTSRQMLLGGDWATPDRKLTLRATHEQSLGSSNENRDFPTRTMLGADYQLTRNVSLFAEQEFTWGEQENTEGTRVGIRATPWQGGEVRTALERESFENGERIFALFGLGQSWQVTQRWSVDLSIDRSYTIKNEPVGERVNPAVPSASGGDDDFTAVSVGTAYTAEKWSWWNRLETRQGDSEDKVGISTGVVGEVREGTAVSARLMAFISDSAGGAKRDEEEITLGMAYRPDRSKWIILERLDVSLYNESGAGADNDGMRIVNHLHANFRANRQWQLSFYYGFKYVRENFDGDRYDGYTDMIAIETRYNLNSRWDVGLHGAVLHSWNSNQFDYSLGADVGYLVMTNAWVSAGYNLVGFEDEDFSAANYTAEGPYVKFRMKFDQQSVKEAAAWLNR